MAGLRGCGSRTRLFQRGRRRDPLGSATPSTVKQRKQRRGSTSNVHRVPRGAYRARRGLVPTPDAVIFAELLSPPIERTFSFPPSRSTAVPLPDSPKGERPSLSHLRLFYRRSASVLGPRGYASFLAPRQDYMGYVRWQRASLGGMHE